MEILVIGSEGYVGTVTCEKLEEIGKITRIDAGWYGVTSNDTIIEDISELAPLFDFSKFDCVVYLAAISNDPMGSNFSEMTHKINHYTAVTVAELSKLHGVNKFIFASSCSAYGDGGIEPRRENDLLKPLTDYALSKVNAEIDLLKLADKNFNIYCLRFATACGSSNNLRLDLVVNDFVASAITENKIKVLSNGEPFRPLISVQDMARAITGVALVDLNEKEFFNIYNVGSDQFTYKIKDLAYFVSDYVSTKPNVEINYEAAPDNRSYKVDFRKFHYHFPDFTPQKNLIDVIKDLENQIRGLIPVYGNDYRNWVPHIRLKALKKILDN